MASSSTRRRVASVRATVIDASGAHVAGQQLAGEEPLEIRVAGPDGVVLWTTSTMRTPGQDFALAAGLLRAEGVIVVPGDLAEIRYCADVAEQQYNVVTAYLRGAPRRDLVPRALSATASCGVCGTASIDEVFERIAGVTGGSDVIGGSGMDGGGRSVGSGFRGGVGSGGGAGVGSGSGSGSGEAFGVGPGSEMLEGPGVGLGANAKRGGFAVDATLLAGLPERLRAEQSLFEATGGLHAAGLFDTHGHLLGVAEDVGRHNALDKVIGERFLAGELPLSEAIAVVSSRVSFELVQKVAVAGVPVLCAVSAPSNLAVETARRLGVTLAAFARGDRVTIYTHPERVTTGA